MMNVFHPFLSDPHVATLFRQWGKKRHMELVASLRKRAISLLSEVVKRVPRETPRIVALYRTKGIELTWDLEDDETAIMFSIAVHTHSLSPDEMYLVALLRACVAADQAGEVKPLVDMWQGAEMRGGRKLAAVGKVRTAIRRILKKSPQAKNAEMWHAIMNRCPKGLKFHHTDKPRSDTARLPWLSIAKPATPTYANRCQQMPT